MRRALSLLLCLLLCAPGPALAAELPLSATVYFYDPLGCVERTLRLGDSISFPAGPEIEGYTFLGWKDAWGRVEPRASVRVYENMAYYAEYAIALRDSAHAPYLTLDESGFFHPWESVTRREAALLVYALLGTELVGDGVFLDVPESDPCHAAVATLKALGALSGSRFHPDEPITRYELLELLSHFYPAAKGEPVFPDLERDDPAWPVFALAAERGWIGEGEAAPEREVSRLEFAHIFNRVMQRSGDREERFELVGTILDLPRSDPYFWDAAEAVIPHRCESLPDGERWTQSEALPALEAGLFFVGVRLHAVDGEGNVVADGEYGGLPYNSRGELTSGLGELDELIWAAMEACLDPATMSREEMLQRMFDYAAHEFQYLGRNHYEFGETGWEQQEALDMLRTGKGNCYSFAAIFYYFARALGYDAAVYSGSIRDDNAGDRPHGWVELEMDGERFLFDPEMQFLYDSGGEQYKDFYRRDMRFRETNGYRSAQDAEVDNN